DFPSADWDVVVRAFVMAGKSRRWVFHSHGYSHMENLDLEHALGDCDAAVLLPGAEPFPDHLVKALRRPSRPVVVLAQDSGQPEASHVFMNDRRIGRMAAGHLLELGHRRIGVLIDQPPTTTTLQRMEGWRDAMRDAGIEDLFPLILDAGVQPYQDPLKACHRFLEREFGQRTPDLTAIFTTSSVGAISTLSWLRTQGIRVPGDLSVLAYCGEAGIAPFLAPALSGIEIDITEFGNAVADLLDDYLEDPARPARQVELHPHMVKRQSVAGPAAHMAEAR
ncbi:MAG: LacI family DNA-binding transcriptional regulator, partial [Kiritimatiellia bacterium]